MYGRLLLLVIMAPSLNAGSGLPFLKHLAGDHELPKPVGISLDYFAMEQDYLLDDLQFQLQLPFPIELPDLDLILVDNEVDYFDVKVDAWLLPFLNVFGVVGSLDGTTHIDFTALNLDRIGIPLTTMAVAYDGFVYAGGMVLAVGGDHWFASAAGTISETDLDGDFESKVATTTVQARLGFRLRGWSFWAGGMKLDAEEEHQGVIDIPGLGNVDFAVILTEKNAWNQTLGAQGMLSEHIELVLEAGFGDRDHLLATLGYRF